MNYRVIIKTLGKLFLVEAILLTLPLAVGIYYGEDTLLSFLIPIGFLVGAAGIVRLLPVNRRKEIYAKEGFVIVALAWILLSLVGALPFTISGQIPSYIDSVFETISGFTTTGASILKDVESLSRSMHFWRCFTHWIGGMGVLVFMLAILPQDDMRAMHILRAEAPGPTVGKLVSKINLTARILYGIYIALTVLMIVFLLFGGMPLFDSIVHAFATAGTGGFSMKAASIAAYNSVYIDVVISVFMLLFGVNFNLFYLLLIGKVRQVLKSDELRWYLGIVAASVFAIAVNIWHLYQNFGQSLRYAFFQVSSIISTTGFATADFDQWPEFSKAILLLLMFIGSCAGSTGGGVKVSRIIILVKSFFYEIRSMANPRAVTSVRLEGKSVDRTIVRRVTNYWLVYCLIFIVSVLLVSLDRFNFTTHFSAVAACINNVGPGFGAVGPSASFADLSVLSKLVLMGDMLLGRLELFPLLVMMAPSTWRRR